MNSIINEKKNLFENFFFYKRIRPNDDYKASIEEMRKYCWESEMWLGPNNETIRGTNGQCRFSSLSHIKLYFLSISISFDVLHSKRFPFDSGITIGKKSIVFPWQGALCTQHSFRENGIKCLQAVSHSSSVGVKKHKNIFFFFTLPYLLRLLYIFLQQ